jgi:hypothetical protein
MKPRENVGYHGVASVRRDANIARQRAAVEQRDFLDHLAGNEIDDAHARSDDVHIRPSG